MTRYIKAETIDDDLKILTARLISPEVTSIEHGAQPVKLTNLVVSIGTKASYSQVWGLCKSLPFIRTLDPSGVL